MAKAKKKSIFFKKKQEFLLPVDMSLPNGSGSVQHVRNGIHL